MTNKDFISKLLAMQFIFGILALIIHIKTYVRGTTNFFSLKFL